MNREQRRLLELLKEFDGFCRMNEIEYCLSGETLLYAFSYESLEPRPCYASVVMDACSCKKLIKAFEASKPNDREIEYWGNSACYPDYTVRYVASDTTAFNILDYFKYRTHGMCIEIQILRTSKKPSRAIRALESGIRINNRNTPKHRSKVTGKKNHILNAYYGIMCCLKGRAGIRRRVFDYLINNRAKPHSKMPGVGGSYDFINDRRQMKSVSEYYFRRLDSCEVEGYSFPIPSNTRSLLTMMYENRYSYIGGVDKVVDNFRYIENCIVDVDVPYADAIKLMGIEEREIAELIASKERVEEIIRRNKPNNQVATADWITVLQTDARFRMWKKYQPIKEDILKIYDEGKGDFEELERSFRPYTQELRTLKPHNRSISFDLELLNIYIDMLERMGDFEEADRIYRQLPKSHFDEINITE